MVECRPIIGSLRTPAVRLTILLLIAGPLYLFAVVRHWLQRVPIIPTATLQIGVNQFPLGYASTGEFKIAAIEPKQRSHYVPGLIGPIEYWNIATRAKVREVFTPHHHLRADAPEFVTRLDEALIVDDATGRVMGPFPTDRHWSPTFHAISPTRAVVTDSAVLTCHDAILRRVVWRLPMVQSIERVVPGHALIVASEPSRVPMSRRIGRRRLVDLERGQFNDRIHPNEQFDVVDLSNDGRFAIILIHQRREVWSLTEGRLLWTMEKLPLPLSGLRFSDDGNELVGRGIDVTGRLWTARLRSNDGAAIVVPTSDDVPDQMLMPTVATAGHKFALVPDNLVIARWSPFPLVWMSRVTKTLGLTIPHSKSVQYLSLYDLESSQRVAIVDKGDARLHVAPDASGFLLERPPGYRRGVRLEYYSFPPQRNWSWLWRWAFGPLILLATGFTVALRRGATRAVGEPQEPAA